MSTLSRCAFLLILSLIVTGCDLATDVPIGTVTAVFSPLPTPVYTPTAIMPSPTPLSTPTATPSPVPPDLSIASNNLLLYPAPQIYAGDKVTFQIMPFVPSQINPNDVTVTVIVDGQTVGEAVLNESNLAGDAFGLLKWAWDTANLAGEHQLRVILDRNDTIQVGDENAGNNQISLPIIVYDRALLPETETDVVWVTAATDCCRVHVVSGTAAYRDLPQLLTAVETAVQQAADRLDESPQQPIEIYFIDRVIGQGGYAGSELVVSYLDRDYAGIDLHQVLVHETVHIIDRQFAPQRISFLAEGLAVWASGGHYKLDDSDQQAAALLESGLYVPLVELVNDFYPVQHEIGYLEAASFVNYLIDAHGWSRFRDFYSAATVDDDVMPAEALDINLQIYYNKTLADMEAGWLAYLDEMGRRETAVTDLQTTLFQYNTMRHYQRLYDPTAYFLNAWLPYPNEVRQNGSPADLTRHPESETNITLEVMLQAASEELQAGNYNRTHAILDSVERVLNNDGLFQDPLALSYKNIVNLVTANDYQVQRINLSGDRAVVWGTYAHNNTLTKLTLTLDGQGWVLTN